jgi:hypothetical protein
MNEKASFGGTWGYNLKPSTARFNAAIIIARPRELNALAII